MSEFDLYTKNEILVTLLATVTPSTRKEDREKKAKLGEGRGTSIWYRTRIKSENE